jgi:hypothetical protein
MSTTGPAPQQQATVRQYTGVEEARYEDEAGRGWVTFAGVILALLAAVNFIDGVAAVSKSTFFVGNAKFVLSDLKTWGWVLIVMAVIQLATAAGVWLRWKGVRWVGVAIAALNAIAQLMIMPAYPFWSLCLFALDVLVIYGLIAHGRRAQI